MGNLERFAHARCRSNERGGAVPGKANGWLVALGALSLQGFYAVGPGVSLWLALSVG